MGDRGYDKAASNDEACSNDDDTTGNGDEVSTNNDAIGNDGEGREQDVMPSAVRYFPQIRSYTHRLLRHRLQFFLLLRLR